jgi:hypothetical protein
MARSWLFMFTAPPRLALAERSQISANKRLSRLAILFGDVATLGTVRLVFYRGTGTNHADRDERRSSRLADGDILNGHGFNVFLAPAGARFPPA